jgi:hypothetical protein
MSFDLFPFNNVQYSATAYFHQMRQDNGTIREFQLSSIHVSFSGLIDLKEITYLESEMGINWNAITTDNEALESQIEKDIIKFTRRRQG